MHIYLFLHHKSAANWIYCDASQSQEIFCMASYSCTMHDLQSSSAPSHPLLSSWIILLPLPLLNCWEYRAGN